MKKNNVLRIAYCVLRKSILLVACGLWLVACVGCAKREIRNIDSKGINIICFGDYRFYGGYGGGSDSYPANGWITTDGINGIKKWEGENIWGDLPIEPFEFFIFDYTYPGVYDFTGISIGNFFMGHADWVKIKQKS